MSDPVAISYRLLAVERQLREAVTAGYGLDADAISLIADFLGQSATEAKALENALSREMWNNRAAREQLANLRSRLPSNVALFPVHHHAELHS